MKKIIVVMVMLGMASLAMAAAPGGAQAGPDMSAHPKVPQSATWVRPLWTLILGLFATAWPVGMFIRATRPEEVPLTHAHDEHHGHKDPDHGHGHDAHGHGTHGH
jgi:hypothetical protein